jgi:probable rRNA maturation factor
MNIELTNLATIPCDEGRIKDVALYSLNRIGIHPDSELSISLVDETEMRSLNAQWMDENDATDVLSFPMDEMKPNSAAQGPGVIGDIVLCPSYAETQARQAGHSLQEELELLTVHGVLHLLGYDHRESEEQRIMFSIQDEYLKGWRIQA